MTVSPSATMHRISEAPPTEPDNQCPVPPIRMCPGLEALIVDVGIVKERVEFLIDRVGELIRKLDNK
jgi:hypothetical protein